MLSSDQFIDDNMEDNTFGFGNTPNDENDENQQIMQPTNQIQAQQQQQYHHQQQQQQQQQQHNHLNGMGAELSADQKLQLAERANEIYRQQLKYMQDHLASLRSLIQDKENIIENLMLRYDLGIIQQDQNRQGTNLTSDEIENEELRRKAEALAQRTILENFELREMVNELRDENFHLRNEIYELQDKINRQVLQINKLEKQINNDMNQMNQMNMMQNQNMNNWNPNDMNINHMNMNMNMNNEDENDIYDEYEDEDNDDNNQQRLDGRRPSKPMNHPANTAEARQKRMERANHARKESEPTPNIFNDNEDEDQYMTEEAIQKRKKRSNHTRKESEPTPNIFNEQSSDDEDNNKGKKRRGSKVLDEEDSNNNNENDDYMDEEALKKRKEREQKHHRKVSSKALPKNFFSDNYDPEKEAQNKAKKFSPEAESKRKERAAKKLAKSAAQYVKTHRRQESLAEKLLLGPTNDIELNEMKTADPEERKRLRAQARKEQRRKSRQMIQMQVGDKGHLSDDDATEMEEEKKTKKKKKYNFKKSQKKSAQPMSTQTDPNNIDKIMNMQQMNNEEIANMENENNKPGHKKRPSVGGGPVIQSTINEETTKHHRRESSAPVPNLGFEDPDVLLHYEKLKVKDLEQELGKRLNEMNDIKDEMMDIKNELLKYQKDVDHIKRVSEENDKKKKKYEQELDDAIESKAKLAQTCAMEIMRLTMVLNTLLQIPKFQQTVKLLIDESYKAQSNNNGSILD